MSSQRERRWNQMVVVIWLLLVGMWGFSYAIPASAWFAPGPLIIEDTGKGQAPVVQFDRTIKRDFVGQYYSTVYRKVAGRWSIWCVTEPTKILYHADATLPERFTTNWWFYPKTCPAWEPGQFKIETEWTIYPMLLPARTVRISSNEFEVT